MKVSIPILILLLGLLLGGCARRADEGGSTAAPPVVKARTAAVERVTVPQPGDSTTSIVPLMGDRSVIPFAPLAPAAAPAIGKVVI